MNKLLLACLLLFPFQLAANPIGFIENVGQVTDQYHRQRSDIHFSLQTGAMNVFVSPGVIHYQFVQPVKNEQQAKPAPEILDINTLRPSEINTYRIDAELVGANKNVQPIRSGQLKYYERYYTPPFGEQGGLAHSFSKITYPDIYPNIDWVIYLNDGKVEYDFIVKQGGNPKDIKIKYGGSASLNIDPAGDLHIACPLGSITEHSPSSFQADGKTVATSFKIENNVVSFDVAPYTGTLLIDPYIEWATYYGGVGEEAGRALTTDAFENVYMCGATYSSNQIATVGAYDMTYADSIDGYIVKFDSSGVRLWATYYGGTGFDMFKGIAWDNHGNVIGVGGTDNSIGIATVGSDQPNFWGPYTGGSILGGGGDGFIAKFDSLGNRIWATYFGGAGIDDCGALACDNSGSIYMAGATGSNTNIATVGAHQSNYGGVGDGFLTKYSSSGLKLWSTYYGGNNNDLVNGITISPDHSTIYICGGTHSTNSIATIGVFQENAPQTLSSFTSAFVASFDTNGNRNWGTYFSGQQVPIFSTFFSVSCNSNSEILAAGLTQDTGLATSGTHQSNYHGAFNNGWGDAIMVKFDNTGNRIWSTYLGGSKDEVAMNVSVNTSDEIYVIGMTSSPDNIAVNAYQGILGGGPQGLDGLIAKFSDVGLCIWSTYLGGNQDNWLRDIFVGNNNFYICGDGKTFPTTSGSHKPNNGGIDAYLAKFHDFPTGIKTITSEKQTVNLYPNPTNGIITIQAVLPSPNEQVAIRITNIAGMEAFSENYYPTGNNFNKTIELSKSLPAGLYILQLTAGNQSFTERFVLQ